MTPPVLNPNDSIYANFSCFNCVYNNLYWDAWGCYNQTQSPTRPNNLTIVNSNGCFQGGFNVSSNTQAISLGDLSQNGSNSFAQNYSCKYTGEELYLSIKNPFMQINQVNATISSIPTGDTPANTTDAYVAQLCQLGVNGSCGAGVISGRGFVNYNASNNETISLWMICLDRTDWFTTLSITALFKMNITTDQAFTTDNSLSGGAIAGIVIASVVVFFSLLAIYYITKKGPVSMRQALIRCCKNKTQSVPTDSPRVQQDIERRETGLMGNNQQAQVAETSQQQ